MGNSSGADKMEERLIDFAVRVIKAADSLPKTPVGKHIAGNYSALAHHRSGTSPAPNYAEVWGAESNADFVHKLKVALTELNETSVWLIMTRQANLMKTKLLAALIDENQQLCRILNASIKTAKKKVRATSNFQAIGTNDK